MVEALGVVERYDRFAEVFARVEAAGEESAGAGPARSLRDMTLPDVGDLLRLTQAEVIGAMRAVGIAWRPRLGLADVARLRTHLAGGRRRSFMDPARRPEQGESLAVCVFANYKGGSGKTTASVHFAHFMARHGYRVLMVDLDSQASATVQFGVGDAGADPTRGRGFLSWTDAREKGVPVAAADLCVPTHWPSIDLVPAGPFLFEAEEDLAGRARSRAPEPVSYFDEFAAFLAEAGGAYDVVVVDVRPDVNFLMSVALHAATHVVVPMRPTLVDLSATRSFFEHLSGYAREYDRTYGVPLGLATARLLLTQYEPLDRSQAALVAGIRGELGDMVYPGEFLHSRVVGTAAFGRESLYEYEPSTDRKAYARVVESANEVFSSLESALWEFWRREPIASGVLGA